MQRFGRVLATMAVALMVMLTVVDLAEARRAGSGFGSRGTRTFAPPPVTRTAPNTAAPIERTMTPGQAAQPGATRNQPGVGQNTAANQRRPGGLFGGFGGSLLGGLALGGLIGMLAGNGLGGGIGFLGLLLQVGLVIGAVMLAMRFFGRGRQTAASGVSPRMAGAAAGSAPSGFGGSGVPSFTIPRIGGSSQDGARSQPNARHASQPADEIGVGQHDLDQFETMLKAVQAAYAAEDYATLRRLTTPEAMSYLAEELSDNATRGLKNEVSDVALVEGDVAEAWREDGADYATVAMRYESIDVVRERATGRVVEGDPDNLTEAVELWTFLRKRGGDWQVSAIQGVAA